MFEDKRKIKTKRYIILFLILILGISFGIGYYLNYDSEEDISSDDSPDKISYSVPDSLINPIKIVPPDNANDLTASGITNILDQAAVGINTEIIFRTNFLKCGHNSERKAIPKASEIGMNENVLASNYTDWELVSFSKERVVFLRSLDTYCPEHFIIGIYGGNIAVFTNNQDGERVLKEETDISISTLPPEDQKALEDGIVANDEEELYMKLEGFSN